MDGCQPFLDWCDAATAWAGGRTAGGDLSGFCPAGALGGLSRIPPMLMYFHQRTEEVLLWVEWIPKTNGAG